MKSPDKIMGLWTKWDSARRNGLNRVRKCCKLTKPWLLPDEGFTDDDVLHEPFQQYGALYVEQSASWIFNEVFSPGQPWFMFQLSPDIYYNINLEPTILRAIETDLAIRELAVMAALESVEIRNNIHSRRLRTFYSGLYAMCEQVVATGDSLVQIGDNFDPERNPVSDNYRLKVFRRDQYVTRRDSFGDVTDHITKEKVDAAMLSPEMRARVGIDESVADETDPQQRERDLYTHVHRMPDYSWSIRQEIEGIEVASSKEPVSPYLSVPYELPPCAHYGRGPVEARLGGFGSVESLCRSMIDWAAMKSDFKFFVDENSRVRDADLFKRPGSVVRGVRVAQGQLQDVTCQSPANTGDFSEVGLYRNELVAMLNQTSQTHQGTQPRGERVTARQSTLIASEVETTRSGGLIPLEDSFQQPLLQRVLYTLKRDSVLSPLRTKAGKEIPIKVEILTGMAQRRRAQKIGALLELSQVAANFGPEAQQAINPDVAFRIYLRYRGLYEPGLVKTPEQRAAEQQAAYTQAVAAEAAQEAISVAGDNARARQAALTGA